MNTEQSWPPVAWEEHPWRSNFPPEVVSRSVQGRHSGPYRAAVPAAIATRNVELPSAAVALADEASIEIARFDGEFGHHVAPFAAILLRSESASSSQIENLTSGAKAVAMADIGEPSKRNAEAIVANVHAMRAALQLSDNLDVHSVLEMHRALLSEIEPDIAGTWRGQQVWIGGTGFGPHEASFVPPHHDRVPDAMRDLMDFVARDDIPVLAHAALTHAQFETIHPFPDGNGRTGRALIHAMLRAKGMSREVTVPVSAGLLTEVERYFDALTAYRQGDPVPIVTAMAEASVAALINGRHLIADLDGIRERWESALTARRDAVAWRLANLLLRQPVLNVATASRELDVTGANVGLALRQLESAGVVAEFSGRTRNRLWQAREVLDALDDFAARAGRRRYG